MRSTHPVTYVELHCHSAFSFLDGASLPDELVATALKLGHETLALTDHNSVSGSMEFTVAARALGLRPIHGAEVNLDDERHLTLLVESSTGWSNLCRILTIAHSHTRQKPGPPTQAYVALDTVLEHADGLVCLSGCALRGVHDEPTLRRLLEAFGSDGLRVEQFLASLTGCRGVSNGFLSGAGTPSSTAVLRGAIGLADLCGRRFGRSASCVAGVS